MAGGFKLMVEATGDVDFDALQAQADALAAQGNRQPGLVGLFSGFRARTPQLYVDVDRTKVKTMGVQLTDVFDAAAGVPGQLLRQRLQPLRPHLAGQRPGRGPLSHGSGDRQATQGPQRRRRHGAAGGGGRGPRLHRADPDRPLQHVPGGRDQRRRAAGRQHRRDPGDDGKAGPEAAAQHDLRVDRAELLAEAVQPGRAVPRPATEPVQRLCARSRAGLLRACGPVRKLVAAVGGDPGRAHVPAERAGGHRPGADGREHLRAGRRSWCWSAWPPRTPS